MSVNLSCAVVSASRIPPYRIVVPDRDDTETNLDPRGSGLLFFMFIRPQPYTCLGIECKALPPSRDKTKTKTAFRSGTVVGVVSACWRPAWRPFTQL